MDKNFSLILLLPRPLYFHSITMPKRTKRDIMLESDVDAADVVTFEEVHITTKGGRTQTKRVKVHLNPPLHKEKPPIDELQETEAPFANDIEMDVLELDGVPVEEPRHQKVRREKFFKMTIIDLDVDAQRLYR